MPHFRHALIPGTAPGIQRQSGSRQRGRAPPWPTPHVAVTWPRHRADVNFTDLSGVLVLCVRVLR
jgi:hypothetical protein